MPFAIPGLLIALRLFMQVLAVWMLRLAYAVTLGLMLRLMASQAGRVPVVGGKLKGALEKADDVIADALGKVAQANERAFAAFTAGLGDATDRVTDALVDLAGSMYTTYDALLHGELPNHTKRATQPIAKRIKDETTVRSARDRAQRRSIDDLGKSTRARDRAEARVRARGIDRLDDRIRDVVLPQVRGLRVAVQGVRSYTARQARALSRRIGRLEAAIGSGVIAAGALAVLSRSFPYWRCTNVKRFNRALCRAPVGALDDLLGLALLSVSSLSIVAFAEEVGEIMEPAADAVHRWIVEE